MGDTEAEMRDVGRVVNMRAWVLAADAERTDLDRIPLSMLIDLYPNLWRYGPRGNVYVAQLARMVEKLDDVVANRANTAFPEIFCEHYVGVYTRLYVGRGELEYQLRVLSSQQGLPSPPFVFMGNTPEDPANPILNHSFWRTMLPRYITVMQEALEQFTYLSLQHDFLNTLDDGRVRQYLGRYHDDCDTWGLPK